MVKFYLLLILASLNAAANMIVPLQENSPKPLNAPARLTECQQQVWAFSVSERAIISVGVSGSASSDS
jgi:hypothetical protein